MPRDRLIALRSDKIVIRLGRHLFLSANEWSDIVKSDSLITSVVQNSGFSDEFVQKIAACVALSVRPSVFR